MGSDFRDTIRGIVAGSGFFIGIFGSIVSIMVVPGPWRLIALLTLFICLTALAGWRLVTMLVLKRRTNKAIARSEYLIAASEAEATKETNKYIVAQASRQDVEWTVQLRADCYSADEALSKDLLEEWYGANPNGFSIIREKDGPRIGHLDLLPIRPGTLRPFLQGTITEREIRGDSLYPPGEVEQIEDIYCEGIIITAPRGAPKNRAKMIQAVAMRSVLLNLTLVIKRISNPQNLRYVYAVAASDSGKDVLEHLGFELQLKGERRKDKDDLYQVEYKVLRDKVLKMMSRRL